MLAFDPADRPQSAREVLDLARRTLPNNMDVEFMTGIVTFDQGRWREGIHFLEKANSLGPLYWKQHFDAAQYYRRLRCYEEYERTMRQVFASVPAENARHYQLTHQACLFEAAGGLEYYRTAWRLSAPDNDPTGRLRFYSGFLVNLLDRNANAAAEVLAGYRGDDAGAKTAFAAARQWLDKKAVADPENGWALSMVAVCDAGLGRKEDAVREAVQAVERTPYGHNVDDASIVRSNLALVYTWTKQPCWKRWRTSPAVSTFQRSPTVATCG